MIVIMVMYIKRGLVLHVRVNILVQMEAVILLVQRIDFLRERGILSGLDLRFLRLLSVFRIIIADAGQEIRVIVQLQ